MAASFVPVLSFVAISSTSSSSTSSSLSSSISPLSPFKAHYHGSVVSNRSLNGRFVIQCSSEMASSPDPINMRYEGRPILNIYFCSEHKELWVYVLKREVGFTYNRLILVDLASSYFFVFTKKFINMPTFNQWCFILGFLRRT